MGLSQSILQASLRLLMVDIFALTYLFTYSGFSSQQILPRELPRECDWMKHDEHEENDD